MFYKCILSRYSLTSQAQKVPDAPGIASPVSAPRIDTVQSLKHEEGRSISLSLPKTKTVVVLAVTDLTKRNNATGQSFTQFDFTPSVN